MARQASERLQAYRRKRNFERTPEPAGDAGPAPGAAPLYVMHKHAASHDHFDLRLEQDGLLRSWALPKGPSLETGEKRLAVEVEDHPLEYGGFEGVIPKGEYGGGTVMLWDVGSWQATGRNDADRLDFVLHGKKLKGTWTLVRTRGKGGREQRQWLLIKRSDPPRHALDPDDLSVASGRSMAEIARDHDRTWDAAQASSRAMPAAPVAAQIPGARRGGLPASFAPQLATLTDQAPAGDDWLHEIKFDGYRILAHIAAGQVRLHTRNGHDWSARFPTQAAQLAGLPVDQAIVDGEIVALSRDGSTSFRRLQEALSRKQTGQLVMLAFDLIHLDGYDLSGASLVARKQALAQLLAAAGFDPGGPVRYSDHIRGQGPVFYEQACLHGLEGIISKRADAPYSSDRSTRWLKVKCTRHDSFLVGGYTPPGGARSGFGALLLGARQDGRLIYCGRVGSGFSQRQLGELHALLQQLAVKQSPFAELPPDARQVRWVRPALVVEVEYSEHTRDGRLRQPRFVGIREDLDPEQVTLPPHMVDGTTAGADSTTAGAGKETPQGQWVAGVRLTHPQRVMYPEQGVTKLDLAHFYAGIQDWILPYLAHRPLSLLRCPAGQQEECFFQKHLGQTLARTVPRVDIRESKGLRNYAYVTSAADIVALVQTGVLEFHPWGSRVDDVEHPDMMIFDLDPAADVAWSDLLRTVRELRARLDALGLNAFLRTTGGKGFHVVVPLQPQAGWDEVKAFARAVSERHAGDEPGLLTTNMAKARRQGRIFIDYLRNGRGATAIASYSARARPGAPVAVPLRWDELGPAMRPDRYTIDNLRRRLGALNADPWDGFYDARRPIGAAMRKAVGLTQKDLP